MATMGGPAVPVSTATTPTRQAGPALPVAVVSDGRAVRAGAAVPVYVVTSGPVQAGPAYPIVAAAAGSRVEGGPAIPVYVVSGSLGSNPLAYTNKVIATSPIGYWPLAEAAGATVALDESGNGRNGAYKAAGEPIAGQTGIGDGRTSALFDGTNDFVNIFTASLQAAFNSAEGTMAVWCKVSAAGDWGDATARRPLYFQTDANNRVRFEKTTAAGQLAWVYIAGGTNKTVLLNGNVTTDWFHLACTWSKSADQFKAYINGAQSGATQTALGTWVGSLSATSTTIGAADTIGSNPWKGFLAHAAVWATPLSAATIATLAVVP